MRIFFITLILIVTSHISAEAQQLPLYSQYVENGFLFNPAMAGSRIYTPVRLTIRKQWAGIDGAPETQALSVHKNFGERCTTCDAVGNPLARRSTQRGLGMGAYIFNDNYGAISRTGIEISYAYHLEFNRQYYGKRGTRLSFGLGGIFYQYKFDGDYIPVGDPLYTGGDIVSYIPDANFGIYLYNSDYFVGFSIAHLFESSVKMGDAGFNNDIMLRHYYFNAGYTFNINNQVSLEPSVIVRRTIDSQNYIDVTAKLYIRNFWLALSYRNNDQLVGMLGVNFAKYYFGYSYDYYSNNLLANQSNGTHEITFGVNLDVPKSMIKDLMRRNRNDASKTRRKIRQKTTNEFMFF
ncbi:MAG: type IX secretion system PorP/SprF family membrane protein [Ancylomarina sp.]|jgi:type IX secretion system PorP/SprF family membrane protein